MPNKKPGQIIKLKKDELEVCLFQLLKGFEEEHEIRIKKISPIHSKMSTLTPSRLIYVSLDIEV